MKIESRGTRITGVPGIAEALILEPGAHFQAQITFSGDKRFVATNSATWPSCSCPIFDWNGHKPDCRREPHARGAKP